MGNIVKKNSGLLPALKILLFLYVLTGILLLILAALLGRFQLSEGAVSVGIVAIYVLCCLLGGLIAGKKMKNRKFIWGMIMGGTYFLILVLGSIIFHRGFDLESGRFGTTLVLCLASGMVGGMIS